MPTYEFDVLVHGKSVLKYKHEGRVYIEGRPKTDFTLLVRNNSGSRVLAVMTVDGLSIMDGKKGSLDGNGYVISPWQTIKIPGWRLDNDDVAKFTFGGIGGSYAAAKGQPRDVGVIGCAIFEEDIPSHLVDLRTTSLPRTVITDLGTKGATKGASGPLRSRGLTSGESYTSGGAPSAYYSNAVNSAEPVCDSYTTTSTMDVDFHSESSTQRGEEKTAGEVTVQNIGTEFGKRTAHAVTEVTFNKKDRPAEVFSMHYDDKRGLKARGIDVDRKVHVANPFPKDAEEGCAPPTGWRG
jgi:hypothetical protein